VDELVGYVCGDVHSSGVAGVTGHTERDHTVWITLGVLEECFAGQRPTVPSIP
jgi:hypothetical protein